MAISASLNISALMAPSLGSNGQTVGAQFGYALTTFTIPLTQGQQRSQAYTMTNAGETMTIDFGTGTAGDILQIANILIVWSASLFALNNCSFNGGSPGSIFTSFFMFGIGMASHKLLNPPLFVTSQSSNQTINTLIGG